MVLYLLTGVLLIHQREMEGGQWIWRVSRSQGGCRGDCAEYPQEPEAREAEEEISCKATADPVTGRTGSLVLRSPGTRQEIGCSLRELTAWVSSAHSTQLPLHGCTNTGWRWEWQNQCCSGCLKYCIVNYVFI